jgi:hypothetical protein
MQALRLIGLAVLILIILFSGAFLDVDYIFGIFGQCRIARLNTFPSPDGSKSVVTYRRECGANRSIQYPRKHYSDRRFVLA